MKKNLQKIVFAIVILLFITINISSNNVMASCSYPSVSTGSYLEMTAFRDAYVYTNSSLTTRGTESPWKAYNAYISKGDLIYVYEITSSYCYVSYPAGKVRKLAYCKTSSLLGLSEAKVQFTAQIGCTVYHSYNDSCKYGSIERGDTVYTIGKIGNRGFLIYTAKSGNRAWKAGWIEYDNASKLKGSSGSSSNQTASTLALSGQTYPSTMTQGSGFTCRGTVSSNYKITKITVGIYNANGSAVSTKTVYPNTYSYDINKIDAYVHFSYAKPGTNYYKVIASDTQKSNVTLQNTAFTVNAKSVESTLSMSGQTYPSTMTQGSGFTCKGIVSSNYWITKVTVGIYDANGKAVSTKTVYPWAKSYSINKIDAYIHFSYAKPGTNYYKVIASDSKKSNVVLQNTQFTVTEKATTPSVSTDTTNQAKNMVTLAQQQVGTKERSAGSDNIVYNDWYYGRRVTNRYSGQYAWCQVFISWLANQNGISTNVIPKSASCNTAMNFFKNQGRFYTSSSYAPAAGDIVYFRTVYGSSISHHVGIVTGCSGNTVYYIDGNNTSTSPHGVHSSNCLKSAWKVIGFAHPAYQ